MKIRSVTCFYDPRKAPEDEVERLGKIAKEAREKLNELGLVVETLRLATTPFPSWIGDFPCKNWQDAEDIRDVDVPMMTSKVKQIEKIAEQFGFSYISMGPALPEVPQSYWIIPELLAATQNSFFSAMIATTGPGVLLQGIRASGQIIAKASTISQDGFANLRFGGLANVQPGTPFFPAAYHNSDRSAIALATESADEALKAFKSAKSLAEARQNLLNQLEEYGRKFDVIMGNLAYQYNIEFKGIDFSLAPFPNDESSLGGALEKLGLPAIGMYGSIAAVAFLADTLDRGWWRRTGFNGLMLPVLEDSVLARRAAEGLLTVKDLLTYSTMCGTGLDTVPLPGDASPAQISAILLDVAAMSVRLAKPLTARLMPIPGKKAGEWTEFQFEYFGNTKVMDLPALPLHGLLSGTENFPLKPRGQ